MIMHAGACGLHPATAVLGQHLVFVLSHILQNSCAIASKLLAVLAGLHVHVLKGEGGLLLCDTGRQQLCSKNSFYIVKPPKS